MVKKLGSEDTTSNIYVLMIISVCIFSMFSNRDGNST